MKLVTLAAITAATLVLVACGEEETQTVVEASDTAAAEVAAPDSQLVTVAQRLSYIVGENVATQFARDKLVLDAKAINLAIEDVQAGKESRLSEEDKQQTITEVQQAAQAAQQTEAAALAEKNVAEGVAYLAENAAKEGVVTTESGLQYKEVVAGEGEKPTAEDTVTVNYEGKLVDGTVFDSSYERGQPAVFPVSGVIAGWVEAIQLMNIGDQFELVIPSELAYGAEGTGPVIGPNATLIFKVELLEISKATAAK